MNLRFYLKIFLRRLPWFLLMLVIGSAAGLVLAKILPPSYISQALLVVESEQIPDTLAASTVQTSANEQLQIIQQRILARDNLIDLANRLKIYGDDGPTARGMAPDQVVADLRKRITLTVTGSSTRATTRNTNTQATLVSVGFSAPTAPLAASVANEVVTMILRENVTMRTSAARQTLDFFQQEVSRLDQELSRISAQILAFKEANRGALPDSLDFRRGQLATAQERLQDLGRQEAQLRERRSQLERMKESAANGGFMPSGTAQSPEQQRLQGLREQLAQAEALLAPTNPRVTLLKSQLAAQEKLVSEQLAASGAVSADGGAATFYDLQLSDIDSQLTFITSQSQQVQEAMTSLQQSIDNTPANAVQLDTMERDYANTQAQYNDAVEKRARAETGDVIEAMSKGQRISVIEQAVAPTQPSKPNRLVIAAAGIAGGAALGLALVLLIELLNPGIRQPADLTKKLGITPLLALPYVMTAEQAAGRRRRITISLVAAAIGVAALLLLVHTQFMPLDLLFERVAGKMSLSVVPMHNPLA